MMFTTYVGGMGHKTMLHRVSGAQVLSLIDENIINFVIIILVNQ